MDFFWPGVLGEPKAFLVFCNSILSLAKKERTHLKQQSCPQSIVQGRSP